MLRVRLIVYLPILLVASMLSASSDSESELLIEFSIEQYEAYLTNSIKTLSAQLDSLNSESHSLETSELLDLEKQEIQKERSHKQAKLSNLEESYLRFRDFLLEAIDAQSGDLEDSTVFEIIRPLLAGDLRSADFQIEALSQHKSSRKIAEAFSERASLLEKLGEIRLALKMYMRASIADPENFRYLRDLGDLSEQMGFYASAIRYCEEGLVLIQDSKPNSFYHEVFLYETLGTSYEKNGKPIKGIEYLEISLSKAKEHFPEEHWITVNVLNSIANCYISLGQYQEALETHIEILNYELQEDKPNESNVSTAYNNVAICWAALGKYEKALEFYNKSYNIDKETLEPNDPKMAVSINNIATIKMRLGRLDEAVDLFEEALAINTENYGSDHPLVATNLNNIGYTYAALREYNKALEFYEKSLSISLNTFGEDSTSLSLAYNNIGLAYRGLNNHEASIEYFDRALSSSLTELVESHTNIALFKQNKAASLILTGRYKDAIPLIESALESYFANLPPHHEYICNTKSDLAFCYFKLEEKSLAISTAQEALELANKRYGRESNEVARNKILLDKYIDHFNQ